MSTHYILFTISNVLFCLLFFRKVDSGKKDPPLKIETFDVGFARVFALGDKDNKYPANVTEMKKHCNTFLGVIINNPVLISGFSKDIENSAARRDAMASLREIFNNELCRRVDERLNTGKDNKIMVILQDISNKADKLAPIRASMSNVYIEAAQPKTKITLKDLACYLKKYVSEMAEEFSGETKKFIYAFMSPFLKIPNRYLKGPANCSWSDVPKPTGKPPKSVELLYSQVATNLLNKYASNYTSAEPDQVRRRHGR